MTLSIPRVKHYLQNFKLEKLFIEELGWDRHSQIIEITIDEGTFCLGAIAQKRGVGIFVCAPDSWGNVPTYAIRRKIETRLAKQIYEHLIIFIDTENTTQIWQWVARNPGQPAACREHKYYPSRHSGESLIQKLDAIAFSISDEESLTLTGTTLALKDAFDRDKVTKRFYDHFKKEHQAFLKFIKGIRDQGDQAWYASLMLNRLMFVYFIQKKGFLDSDRDYLKNRLNAVQERKGKGKFLTFYRYFLLTLFHQGFATQPSYRKLDKDLKALIGNVPYLDGGLFDLHELENKHPKIDIDDEAFEKLFSFFDQYEWYLDNRPLANDREINPDVLGYIFEKYINQKEMGAYYTKEDITEYISKNTIVPYLFDEAKKQCKVAFEKGATLWRLLRDDPDRYIFPAVREGVIDKHGEIIPLPKKIKAGINDVSKRSKWNQLADAEYALPTETWREHVARRNRCLEIREKLQDGSICKINDLITYNLDIRKFAQDVILLSEGPELLRAFYRALAGHIPNRSNKKFASGISVLDPTCGSGAFLFAALNVLEPLYEACLERMQGFIDDLEQSKAKHSPRKFEDFKTILRDIESHPSRSYYIYKSIVVKNLYGVDIMAEAVEICKLRLFLKLVAQVDRPQDIEPLPDIDFNIRTGNTLVGFVTREEVRRAAEWKSSGKQKQAQILLGETESGIDRIEAQAEIVERAFQKFRQMQTKLKMDSKDFAAQKNELRQRLNELTDELNKHLSREYGVGPEKPKKYQEWLDSHQPFHWFAEFYGIIASGGFNVLIGNPPYIEYRNIKTQYQIKMYETEPCGNLYAFTWERCLRLENDIGMTGMIVPVSSMCTAGYIPLQQLLKNTGMTVVSSFNDRPSKLFEGIEHARLSIILHYRSKIKRPLFTSVYNKWQALERPYLFQKLSYSNTTQLSRKGSVAKIGSDIENSILNKVNSCHNYLNERLRPNGRYSIFYTRKLSHFVQILDFIPKITDSENNPRQPSELKALKFEKKFERDSFLCYLNSSLFYWLLTVYSDCRNLNKREIVNAPFCPEDLDKKSKSKLNELCAILMSDIKKNSKVLDMNYHNIGKLRIQCTYPKLSKPIIDKIDRVISYFYNLSKDELDFIQNYDIKYRMSIST